MLLTMKITDFVLLVLLTAANVQGQGSFNLRSLAKLAGGIIKANSSGGSGERSARAFEALDATELTHTSGISASQTYQKYNSNPFSAYDSVRYTPPRTVSSSSSCQCSSEVNSSGGNCTRTYQGRRWCYLNRNYSSYRCPDVKYSRSNKPWSFIGCQNR